LTNHLKVESEYVITFIN